MRFLFDRAEKLPEKAQFVDLLRSLIGGTLGIFILMLLSEYTGNKIIMAPFGATCVLLFAVPHSPLAKPRNVIFGQLIAALVGLVIIKYVGISAFTTALGVGISIFLMHLFKCLHPPAGATTLVLLMTADKMSYDWNFLVVPVLAGSVALLAVAVVVNNIKPNQKWPAYWFALVKSRIENHIEHQFDSHCAQNKIPSDNNSRNPDNSKQLPP